MTLDLSKATLKEVNEEINRLQKAVKKGLVWPKTIKLYVHSDKDSNYELADELGLDEDALENFMYAGYEVKLTIEVYADGHSVCTHLDNVELVTPARMS